MYSKIFWCFALICSSTVNQLWSERDGAIAAPVASDQMTDIDFRRTTLVVSDIETSLEFYRDALGMEVIYDRDIITPTDAQKKDADKIRRLVFLRANDDYVGIIGLLQYTKPKMPRIDLKDAAFNEGTVVMVFNTKTLEKSFAQATKVDGVNVLSEPSLVKYSSYDGKGEISVKVSVLQDPDGFTVELNQLQEALH